MPFAYQMTWVAARNRWRKRYCNKTYYLQTKCVEKRDRPGYLKSLSEWEVLKAHLDGLGPSPYATTGALTPEGATSTPAASPPTISPPRPEPNVRPDDPPFVVGVGLPAMLHPELVLDGQTPNVYTGERHIEVLADFWLDHPRPLRTRTAC